MAERIRKIQDNFNDGFSRADYAFDVATQKRFFRLFRKNITLPAGFATEGMNVDQTTRVFKLAGLQFGNWLTTEDRYDYLSIFYVSMNDMNKVLKFGNNLGLDGNLKVTFGSRGVANAKAHFSPRNMLINLSRYHDAQPGVKSPKMARFISTGCVGSLAHEYGHFIDGIIGAKIDPTKDFFLTGPDNSVNWKLPYPDKRAHPFRAQMRKIMDTALLDEKGNPSAFGQRLKTVRNRDYFCSNVEIWARIFETYVCYKLHAMKIENTFLTKPMKTYSETIVYPRPAEMKKLIPEIDKLIGMIRLKVNTSSAN